jgi:hypothetical protein
MTANNSRTRKAKGRSFQNWLSESIRELFKLSIPDVKPALMGESGMDIKLSSQAREVFNFACECKNVERLNVWEAWKQAEINAEKESLEPALFIKRARQEPLMVIDAEYGLKLIQELQTLKGKL